MIFTQQEWYTRAEVAIHNHSRDCWVSLNGKVLNLTQWVQDQCQLCHCAKSCTCEHNNWYCEDDCVERCTCFKRGYFYCDRKRVAVTIVAYAGKDISHWFEGQDWVRYMHAVTTCGTTFRQHGHGEREPVVPSTRWRPVEKPWWQNESFVVGKVTARSRPIRITNTLTGSTVTLEVCSEETVYQVMMRYLPHNAHMLSYTFRYLGRGICLSKTLTENGIHDERETFSEVGLPENLHVPAILVYFNDDLTEDPPICSPYHCYCLNPKLCLKRLDKINY